MPKYSKKTVQDVENLVRPVYDKIQVWAHGWIHIEKVANSASDLAKLEGVDPVLCKIAALCHDLGRLEEEQKGLVNPIPGTPNPHAGLGVKPTEEILKRVGITGGEASQIVEAVKIHSTRKYEGDNKIALILQDADRTDGFGKIGILRAATFNCEIKTHKPESEEDLDSEIEKVKEILKNDEVLRQRMITTLNYVFGWVDVLANTRSLKKYIAQDYEYNKKFLEEIKQY